MLVHSPFLRWLARPLLPKGWTANSFRTAGDVDAQRVALRTLGTRLAVVSIFSFTCKSASVATSYFARDVIAASAQLESIIFLATVLAVQAVPSAVTLLLLSRLSLSHSSGALTPLLLTRDGEPAAGSVKFSAAAEQSQQTSELAAEVTRLQAELRAKAEQASRKQEENAQLTSLLAQLAKLQQPNQRAEQANTRSQ